MSGQLDVLRLIIPGFVPDSCLSLNGRRRAHWTQIRNAQDAAAEWLTWTLHTLYVPEHRPSEPIGRARVTVEFVYPIHRRRDPDGLAGMVKPLLDVLVRESWLVDDDSDHVDLTVRAMVEPHLTETRIQVENLGQPGRKWKDGMRVEDHALRLAARLRREATDG